MDRIRVLVVGSQLLRDIIEGITVDQPDIEVAEDVPEAGAVSGSLNAGETDVLICPGDGAALTPSIDVLLYEHPRLRIVVVRESQRSSFLVELRPRRCALGDVGPDGLLAVIRNADTARPIA